MRYMFTVRVFFILVSIVFLPYKSIAEVEPAVEDFLGNAITQCETIERKIRETDMKVEHVLEYEINLQHLRIFDYSSSKHFVNDKALNFFRQEQRSRINYYSCIDSSIVIISLSTINMSYVISIQNIVLFDDKHQPYIDSKLVESADVGFVAWCTTTELHGIPNHGKFGFYHDFPPKLLKTNLTIETICSIFPCFEGLIDTANDIEVCTHSEVNPNDVNFYSFILTKDINFSH